MAKLNFKTTAEKNDFFQKLGAALLPSKEDLLGELNETSVTPQQIIEKIKYKGKI